MPGLEWIRDELYCYHIMWGELISESARFSLKNNDYKISANCLSGGTLKFKQLKRKNDKESSGTLNVAERYQTPIHVWVSVQEVQNYRFERSTPGEWKVCVAESKCKPITVLLVWIEFQSQRPPSSAFEGLHDFFTNQSFCDITFNLAGKENIGAHRKVVATSSPIFATMLNEKSIIDIDDTEPEIFKAFLTCMYGGKVEDEAVLWKVLLLADKYGVEVIKEECEWRLRSLVNNESCLRILVAAKEFAQPLPLLMDTAFNAVAKKLGTSLSSGFFEELKEKYPALHPEIVERFKSVRYGYSIHQVTRLIG